MSFPTTGEALRRLDSERDPLAVVNLLSFMCVAPYSTTRRMSQITLCAESPAKGCLDAARFLTVFEGYAPMRWCGKCLPSHSDLCCVRQQRSRAILRAGRDGACCPAGAAIGRACLSRGGRRGAAALQTRITCTLRAAIAECRCIESNAGTPYIVADELHLASV